jgi:hypothetical protein
MLLPAISDGNEPGKPSALKGARSVWERGVGNVLTTLQWHFLEKRGGEAQEVAQEKRARLTRELEERKQPILKRQWSPRQVSRGDACANGCGSGDVPTRKCQESTDSHEKQ